TPVMGGVSILLFGIIASSGLRMLVENKIDFGNNRNLIIASVILVLGIGKAHLDFTGIGIHLNIEGMALAATVGILLNLILPKKNILSKADLTKDEILNFNHKAQDLKEQGISSIDRKATVANLFFENSTRTKCSFEMAERKLGLDILPFETNTPSVQKGVTLY